MEVDVSKGNEKYINSITTKDWYDPKINIIDGVCVAHCVHFTRQVDWGYCSLSNDSMGEFQEDCKLNKNCYYKQMKRAEQKLEKIKEYCIRYGLGLKKEILQIIEGEE